MVSFFSENYYIYHYSNVFSNAFIFMIILILVSIFLPFFTNIGVLDKFWKPNMTYTGHPVIVYNDKYYLEITDKNDKNHRYSFDDKFAEEDAFGVSFDAQYDNNNELKSITFTIEINKDIQITDLKFYFFFDCYITEDVNFHIKSKAHVFYSNDYPFSSFISTGDLVFMQNKGLEEKYFMENKDDNNDFDNEINAITTNYFSRNDDYYFDYKKNIVAVENTNTQKINLIITVNIPYNQEINVLLPNYTNLKNKWVLYSILFFPTLFVCFWLMGIVINNKIFKTRIRSDIPLKI